MNNDPQDALRTSPTAGSRLSRSQFAVCNRLVSVAALDEHPGDRRFGGPDQDDLVEVVLHDESPAVGTPSRVERGNAMDRGDQVRSAASTSAAKPSRSETVSVCVSTSMPRSSSA